MTGMELLKAILPKEKWAYFKARRRIVVRTKKYRYLIRANALTMIYPLRGSKPLGRACIALAAYLPDGFYVGCPQEDKMAAEYLLLTNNERRWHATANISWTPE